MKSHFFSAVSEAERCVCCGLCLPRCPTYLKTQSEADSPRGRIVMIKAVLEKQIPLNERFIQHIDLCLTCRACENVCPNQVEYGRLVETIRKPIGEKRSLVQKMARKTALFFFSRPHILENLVRAYRKTGLRLTGKLEKLIPDKTLPKINRTFYSSSGSGEVALFLGCIARFTDAQTQNAAIYVLNKLGYAVHVPKGQGCCGVLHKNTGDDPSTLMKKNLSAFAKLNVEAILTTASGCGAELLEYREKMENAAAFSGKIFDISEFLVKARGWEKVSIAPLKKKILVQDPCSLKNVLKKTEYPYLLLEKIPGAKIEALPGNNKCCGGAGVYFLTQPEMANSLLDDKIGAYPPDADYLATSNIGCALAISSRASGINVMHPVVILAKQMGFAC